MLQSPNSLSVCNINYSLGHAQRNAVKLAYTNKDGTNTKLNVDHKIIVPRAE